MAKKQPFHEAVDRKPKSISTSAVFKKARVHVTNETASKTEARPSGDPNSFKKYKSKYVPEHPLATVFSESLSNSREQIKQQATASLTSICQSASSRAIDIQKRFDEQLQAASTSDSKLLQPLQNEELQFKSHDGKSSGIVKLSDRMTSFRKLVASEEKALESLRKEWMEVQKEITAVAMEVLGVKGLEELMSGKMKGELVTTEQRERAKELEGIKTKFLGEVETASKDALEGMRQGEKELKIRESKQRKRLFDLFTVDD